MSAQRTVLLTIAGTVLSAIVLALLFGMVGLWRDVDVIKTQQLFYHGPWPPPYQGGARRLERP